MIVAVVVVTAISIGIAEVAGIGTMAAETETTMAAGTETTMVETETASEAVETETLKKER